MKRLAFIVIFGLLFANLLPAAIQPDEARTVIQSETATEMNIRFDLSEVERNVVELEGAGYFEFSMTGEGVTSIEGKPVLPAVSRYVVVPGDRAVELVYRDESSRRLRAVHPPKIAAADADANELNTSYFESGELFPSAPVEMSEPILVRNIRMVMITAYPLQYDPASNSYIERSDVDVELRFTDGEPVNPVKSGFNRLPSRDFQTLVEAMTLNPPPHRDDRALVEARGYNDYYLFVMPDNIPGQRRESADMLVERLMNWKRRSGNKVELLLIDNGRSPDQIEDGIQDRYDALIERGEEPFDHIFLIGEDETNPYSNNRGRQGFDIMLVGPTSQFATRPWVDHWDIRFAYLEGDDQFPDVSVSRFHTGDLATLACGTNKTISYESEPFWDNTDWYTEAVTEEQSIRGADDGMTKTVDYYEEAIEQNGFELIDTWRRSEDGGGDPANWLCQRINSGIGFIAGRAKNYELNYVWGRTPQNMLEVVGMYPVAILNSGHGEWAMESLFWVGREWYTREDRYNSLEGAKGCVATTSTWSRPATTHNNCLGLSTVHAFLDLRLSHGWSRVFTALNFNRAFPGNHNQYIKYTEDHGFCGDPGIKYWKGVPQRIEVEHTDELRTGQNYFTVRVTGAENDEPMPDILVTLYTGDMGGVDLFELAYTDENGFCEFTVDPEFDDDIMITALETDIYPYKGIIERGRDNEYVRADIAGLDDEEDGNGDGVVNPGEWIVLTLEAFNFSDEEDAENVVGVLSSHSPFAEVEENEIEFGDVEAEGSVEAEQTVTVQIHPACPDGEPISLVMELEADNGSWRCSVPLDPVFSNIEVASLPNGGIIPTGRVSELSIELRNIGRLPSRAFTAHLLSGGWIFSVIEGSVAYPAIDDGDAADPRGDGFQVSGSVMAVPGMRVPASLAIEVGGTVVDSAYFTLQIGEPRENAPIGPDAYGYICFDDTDEDFEQAPEFDWIEISPRANDPDFDGDEVDVNNNDNGFGVVDLPFDFQYYGQNFDRITVCTNGFLSMGTDPNFVPNFQNWPLDGGGAGGGYGMIAPLWDDLRIGNGGGIYTAYDEEWGRFIIEWYNMTHGNDLTFQVQLYDPEIWANATGDGNILIQYEEVSNVRGSEPNYASVGITSPGNTSSIAYSYGNDYPTGAAPIEDGRAILFTTAPRNIVGRLFGTVTDAATGDPIEEAIVYTGFGQASFTDAEGVWEIPDALALPFTITAHKQGYNDSTLVDTLEEDDEIEFNFSMLHPEFTPSVEDLAWSLAIDEEVELDFELENSGNGPLNWYAERRLRGGADADPWERRGATFVGQAVEDDRIEGVAFVDDHFYVVGSHDREPAIYVLDREGEVVETIEQPGDDDRGMRDLAWDGELIWGTVDEHVYGFTVEGEVQTHFEGPFRPITTITYDPDHELLWMSSTTTDIIAVTRDGEVIEEREIDRQNLRIYGLAYWPEDPDGAKLYILHKDRDTNQQAVNKFNIDTGEMEFVRFLEPEEGGSPGGAFITNQLDVYSWAFLAISSNSRNDGGDRIDFWQLDARKDWMQLNPTEGVLEAGESEQFVLTLNSTGLPTVTFEGDLAFTHNATGGETLIPVTLEVSMGAGAPGNRRLEFLPGWNMVSLNIEPDEPEVETLLNPLVEAGILTMMKDGEGHFWAPDEEFNNIPDWDVMQGYQVNVREEATLDVGGIIVAEEEPIPLEAGWNMTAYLPRHAVEAIVSLAGISEQLVIAKDGLGNFYLPEFEFSNLGELREGQGYQFKVSEDVELIYRLGDQAAMTVDRNIRKQSQPVHFAPPAITGTNMSLLLIAPPETAGYEVAALTAKGDVAGSARVGANGRCGMAVWGDDPATPGREGLREGEPLALRMWDGMSERALQVELLAGEPEWQADGFAVSRVEGVQAPDEFALTGAYPNPFNAQTRLTYTLPGDGRLTLTVHDVSGREVARLVDRNQAAGYHTVAWQADRMSSGVYFTRLTWQNEVRIAKLTLVK